MRSRCAIAVICLVLGAYGQALAHGAGKHGKATPADAQMEKMHAMMPMFSLASARLEKSIEKGDTAAVESEAGKMLAAIPDLKKTKPHKNIKQRKEFVELATRMERNLISTVELVKSGDLAGAKTAFKKVEEICAACHAKFR